MEPNKKKRESKPPRRPRKGDLEKKRKISQVRSPRSPRVPLGGSAVPSHLLLSLQTPGLHSLALLVASLGFSPLPPPQFRSIRACDGLRCRTLRRGSPLRVHRWWGRLPLRQGRRRALGLGVGLHASQREHRRPPPQRT
jgi:hypothetical protein